MRYLLAEWTHQEEDEPYLLYSEMDEERRETRRVEFYRNGITFSYGGERGNEGALRQEPFPEDLRDLQPPEAETEGDFSAQEISPGLFYEIWNQAQERPDGFMGIFF